MRDTWYLAAYGHPNGRIICRATADGVLHAWAMSDYIQWDEEHGKYALYKYNGEQEHFCGGVIQELFACTVKKPPHDRVGAEPSFERALDWLLRGGR